MEPLWFYKKSHIMKSDQTFYQKVSYETDTKLEPR